MHTYIYIHIKFSASHFDFGPSIVNMGVWPSNLPIDSLPLQLLAMSPDLISDLSKQPCCNLSTSVAGRPTIRNKSLFGMIFVLRNTQEYVKFDE